MAGGASDKTKHVTTFHEVLNAPSLPQSEKIEERLIDEATSLIGAGTLSASHILSLTTLNILTDIAILHKLCHELEIDIPDSTSLPSQAGLESLPYLKAVVNDGLRLSYGTMHRLTRCHPIGSLIYTDQSSGKVYVIPLRTPVGNSNYFLHRDAVTFPDPETFSPERWLVPLSEHQKLEACLNTFVRGTRQCEAINLAYAELYLTIAAMCRRLGREMVLYDTVFERDVKGVRDYFLLMISKEGKGVRVRRRSCGTRNRREN